MIASIRGSVTGRDERSITIDVHGVGLRVFALPRTIEAATLGTDMHVHTHLHVREDALDLFGFGDIQELRLFEKLLTVSGVGPRVAMGVLSAASVADLESAIERGQASVLTKVSGVGTKTAERIIVDLKGKLEHIEQHGDRGLDTVIDALVNLGYTAREAREAATKTTATGSVEERIRQALKQVAE